MIRQRRYAKEHDRSRALFPSSRRLLIVGCAGIIAITLIAVTFFSSLFTIEFIDIEAQGGIEERAVRALVFSQMEQRSLWIFPQKNIFFFSSKQAHEALMHRFVLERTAISKRFPHTLRVTVIGKPFRLLLIGTGTIFDLASDGSTSADLSQDRGDSNLTMMYARALANAPDRIAIPPPKDDVDAPLVLSDASALDQQTVVFIRSIFTQARDAGYRPLVFEHSSHAPTIRMKTRQGWYVLFSSIEDPDSQIKNVKTILDSHFKRDNQQALDYIDVRFARRVFYKER